MGSLYFKFYLYLHIEYYLKSSCDYLFIYLREREQAGVGAEGKNPLAGSLLSVEPNTELDPRTPR